MLPLMRVVPVALLLLLASPAAANIAAIQRDPALWSAPGQLGPRALSVEREQLDLDCEEAAGRLVCTFRATYHLRNATDREQRATCAFYGIHAEGVRVRVAGRAAGRPLTPDQIRQLDAAVQAVALTPDRSPDDPDRAGFSLAVAPGSTTIEASGTLRPGPLFVPSYAVDPVRTRHPLLGTRDTRREFDMEYLVAPIRTFGGAPAIHVTLRHPASWRVSLMTRGKGRQPETRRRTVGETQEVRLELRGADVDRLMVHLALPPRFLLNGGVLLGVGGAVDSPRGLRARVGYEVAAPGWLFHALSLDTDFQDELVVAPTVEAATSGVFVIIPSLAVGLGVPVRLLPEVSAGVRFQLTIQWPFVGLVTALDLYPGLDPGDAGFFQATILGQVAL